MHDTSLTNRPPKQQQIMETAEALFMRHGIKRISVEEICRTAGVSKMTFYKYFPNKYELAKFLWRGWMDEGMKGFEAINQMDLTFPEKLTLKLRHKIELQKQFSPEMVLELMELDLDLEELNRQFLAYIAGAQAKGEVRPEVRPEFIMAALDKLGELARDEDLRRLYPDLESFTRELWNFFFYGLLPRPEAGPA